MNARDIETHYAKLPAEGGFDGSCRMTVPDRIEGKTILNVGCRRGKGVFKLSQVAGTSGFVVGVDWREAFVKAAREGEHDALCKSGLAKSNMAFAIAYPEMLDTVITPKSIDVAYINDVINICADPSTVLVQIARALKPTGMLACQTVIAEATRNEDVVREARALGNSIQAAPTNETFVAWLAAAGFDERNLKCEIGTAVDADKGATTRLAPLARTPEEMTFTTRYYQVHLEA